MDKSLRILHFSDFHLNGDKLPQAEHVLEFMNKALLENKVVKHFLTGRPDYERQCIVA